MATVSFRVLFNALKMISQLSFEKEVLLILTLNYVRSCSSQLEALKRDTSTRDWIALAVALPGVEKPCVVDVAARLWRPLLAARGGINGGGAERGMLVR